MMNHHESWAGNILAWITVSGFWETYGASLTSFVVTCLVGWWTVEKALAERARRRAYDRMTDGQDVRRSLLARLFGKPPITEVGELDQSHHDGK